MKTLTPAQTRLLKTLQNRSEIGSTDQVIIRTLYPDSYDRPGVAPRFYRWTHRLQNLGLIRKVRNTYGPASQLTTVGAAALATGTYEVCPNHNGIGLEAAR